MCELINQSQEEVTSLSVGCSGIFWVLLWSFCNTLYTFIVALSTLGVNLYTFLSLPPYKVRNHVTLAPGTELVYVQN